MRKLVLALLTVCAVIALVGQTTAGDKPAKDRKHPYCHTVIFYLKKDAPKNAAETLIADCHKLLEKIPEVHGLRAGRPAEKATPKVSVNDYSVGLVIMLDDASSLQTYIDHPLHTEFVKLHMPNIDRVVVYDFANQMK